jgi:CotH protein
MKIRLAILAVGAVMVAALLGAAGHAQFDQPSRFRQLDQSVRSRPLDQSLRSRTIGRRNVPRQGFGGFANSEEKLVARFDKDKDGRLNRAERTAARAAAGNTGQFGFGRRPFRFGSANAEPGRRLAPADVRSYPATTPLYDLGALRTIFLQFENDDWEEELAAFKNTDVEVPATMTVDGRTYKEVGVHFRGASSFMMVPEGLKRSLNISTDFAVKDQDLYGYRTLNLLNANNDPTFLRAVLYTDIARRYLPAPKMNYMRVVINGESWGVYLNAQQFNSDMLRDDFKTTKGVRWKTPGSPRGRAGLEYLGDDAAAYKQIYEIKTKDEAESWNALIQLCKVLNQTPPEKLEAALAPLLDVDGALKFLAVEVALVNSDGYWTRASDYNLYRDPKGQFHILPHDVNEGLGGEGGGFGFGGGSSRLDPLVAVDDPSKPLRSRLLAVPALRQRYLGYVRDIATRWLDWNAILPVLKANHDLIASEVRVDTRKLYDVAGFEAGIAPTGNPLKSFIDTRRTFLLTAAPPAVAPARVAAPAADNSRRAAN